jgi:hypothetical protein
MYSCCWMPNEERNFPSLLRPFTFSFLQDVSQVISFVWNWNNYFCVMKDFYYFSEEFIRMKLNSSLSNGKHLGLRNSRIGLQLGNYFLFQSVLPVFFASTVSTTLLFKLTLSSFIFNSETRWFSDPCSHVKSPSSGYFCRDNLPIAFFNRDEAAVSSHLQHINLYRLSSIAVVWSAFWNRL